MRLTKVALVDAGANQEADILIYKRRDPIDKALVDLDGDPRALAAAVDAALDAVQEAFASGNGDQAAALLTAAEETVDALLEVLGVADADEMAEEPLGKGALVASVTKSAEERVAELEAELTALSEMSNDDLAALKGIDVAKADAADELEKSRIEKADLSARIEKMERERRVESFVRKARDDFGDLAPAAELGAALEEVERVAPDAYKALDGVLKAVAARAATSLLFKELGGSGSDESTPFSKYESLVAKKLEANPEMSAVDAKAQVLRETPDLYKPASEVLNG